MTYQNINDSLSEKRRQQLAVVKFGGGTLFQITGIEQHKETGLFVMTIGTMPEIEPPKIDDNKTMEDLFAELGV